MIVTVWFILLVVTFSVSVLTMSYIQVRMARRAGGWRFLNVQSLRESYWRQLSVAERCFLWPGLVAFAITLVIATASLVVAKLR